MERRKTIEKALRCVDNAKQTLKENGELDNTTNHYLHSGHETTRHETRVSLHIDASHGTMTCDYDHDCFGQGQKFQHSSKSGHGHGQWSAVMVSGHGQWSVVSGHGQRSWSVVMVSGHGQKVLYANGLQKNIT